MSILQRWLPQDCLLCGDPAEAPLCMECNQELPLLAPDRCPCCAEPTPAAAVCGACLKTARHFDATVAAFRYAFPVDRLIQALKYHHRLAIADFLGGCLLAGPRPEGDLLIPVPLSDQRLRQRGFNQAVELARPIARALRLPLMLDQCTRSRDTPPQAALPWKARQANIRHAFECAADLGGRSVIVVDDVMTSGATIDEFARTLKAHGAVRVSAWVVARATRDSPPT